MRKLSNGLLMIAVTTVSSSVLATEPEELDCGSKFDTVETVNQCLSDAVKLVERDLETMRVALLKALDVARTKLQTVAGASTQPADPVLEKAQKAWRAYRDTNCSYYDHAYAGVSSPDTERVVCLLRMTRQRMLELNSERQFWVYKFREPDMQEQVPAVEVVK